MYNNILIIESAPQAGHMSSGSQYSSVLHSAVQSSTRQQDCPGIYGWITPTERVLCVLQMILHSDLQTCLRAILYNLDVNKQYCKH